MSTAPGLLEPGAGGARGSDEPARAWRSRGYPWPLRVAPWLRSDLRLVECAREPPALRRALARVVGRLVAARAWERLGFARLEDYAVERAGLSARELRDLARVDRALETLPSLESAFLAGRIGWTQLRLLCRVARREDEREWLAFASKLDTRQLAREVRAVDACARGAADATADEDDHCVGVVLRCTPLARARWWHARQVANRVAGRSLSPGNFAEALAAEVASAVPIEGGLSTAAIDPSEASFVEASRCAGSPPSRSSRRLCAGSAPVAFAWTAELERGLESADAFELDARLRRALRAEARRLAEVATGLADVVARGLHRHLGFRSVDSYAEGRLGIAPSRARALLRIARAAARCPELGDAFRAGRISWVQAHALVPLLLAGEARPHRAQWIAHALRVSVRRLRDDVEGALASGELAAPCVGMPAAPVSKVPADRQTGAIPRLPAETARLFFAAPPEVAQLFRSVLACTQRRIERIRGRPSCRSEALEAMIEHAVATWEGSEPRARTTREQRVFARDGWRCTAPGCSSYRNLHAHHVVFRSAGGSDAPGNLTTLCAWHHLRGVHAGVVSCRGRAPKALHFELGVRHARPPLVAYGPGEVRCSR